MRKLLPALSKIGRVPQSQAGVTRNSPALPETVGFTKDRPVLSLKTGFTKDLPALTDTVGFPRKFPDLPKAYQRLAGTTKSLSGLAGFRELAALPEDAALPKNSGFIEDRRPYLRSVGFTEYPTAFQSTPAVPTRLETQTALKQLPITNCPFPEYAARYVI